MPRAVRDMFEQAKKHAPCIIFIDEIDAVGIGTVVRVCGGGHDEREQTLNQLLVEMDGFEGNEGIHRHRRHQPSGRAGSGAAAPRRFDARSWCRCPAVRGREQILRVHMRRVPLAEDVKPQLIARARPDSPARISPTSSMRGPCLRRAPTSAPWA